MKELQFKNRLMMNKNQDSQPSIEEVYRQYIEFVNQITIYSPVSLLLLTISDIVILADLLLQLAPNNTFIINASYFAISPMLYSINITSTELSYLINICVLIILLSPLLTLFTILYHAYWSESLQNGGFKEMFERSFINRSIRTYFISFSYIFLPVFLSYGTKILNRGGANNLFGIVIIVWAIINAILIEYHIFQLGDNNSKNKNLVPINYPYHMIDNLLVVIVLISINLTSQSTSFIVGLIFISLRLGLAFYTPFYNDYHQKIYKIIVISSMISAVGLLVSYYNVDKIVNLLLIALLIGYLLYIQTHQEEVPVWEQIKPVQQDNQGLQTIKNNLCSKGLFARSFRSLIFLGRQNRSHRTQLQIEIMKSKCLTMQKIHRGGARVCGAKQVIKFQQNLLQFMENFLKSCDLSVSILKFMQSKEGKKQILANQIEKLVNLLIQNKQVIKSLLLVNEYSHEAKFLLIKTYTQLYYDNDFVKEMQKQLSESILNDNQKEIKDKLFNDKCVIVFINILQEIGKVVKISKNLPSVLGYQPTNLLGLSINQIIPFSVKEFHDQHLLSFIEKYSNKDRITENKLKFYAYNKDFHLQEIIIRYSWVMSDFNSFHMGGIIEKVQSDQQIILTDQYGNLEGWTRKIGGEEFNLDLISISERKSYNIMPLFPTLIKYMDSLGVVARTIFFKNTKPRDNTLVIVDSASKQKIQVVQPKLLNAFKKLLRDQQIVGACFAEIEFVKVSLCQGRANMRQIIIREYESIENLSEVTTLIEKLNTNNSMKTDKSLVSCNQLAGDSSQKQEKSLLSEDNKSDKKIDSNFTLNAEGDNFFPYEQLIFGQFNSSKTTFQLSAVSQNSIKKRLDRVDQNSPVAQQAGFNYTLHKNSTLFFYVALVSAVFLVLFILNLLQISQVGRQFLEQNESVLARNKAASIYLKSIFNPNETYINRFANGALIQNRNYLYNLHLNYTSFLGDVTQENLFYLFNTQIPATLQRLITNPLIYSNATVDIIPPTNAIYYSQITANCWAVAQAYDKKFKESLNVWYSIVDVAKKNFFIKYVFLCLGALVYCFLLILMYYRQKRHKQTLEAFFKFQKQDLQTKINSIGALVRELEAQAAEQNLIKEFSQIVKKQEITNAEFSLIKNIYDGKIKFDHDQQTENNIESKRYYIGLGILIAFLVFQVIFLTVHAVINVNALSYFRKTPADLDDATTLIIQPNFLLADIYVPMPAYLKADYYRLIDYVLAAPIPSIPELFTFLSTVPCPDCNFMYPVLTTNYKSFYRTFEQQVLIIKAQGTINKTKIQDLFYAADYVIEKIIPALLANSYKYVDFSIFIYLISMIILCVAIYMGTKSINNQIAKLQLFLRFFSSETITKNKHMSRLFSNQ